MTVVALTITEALAELKTIARRLEKKQQFVEVNLFRQERFKDPLSDQGGSSMVIRSERQSIHDLRERMVTLRREIAYANAGTLVTVNGVTRSIADWLVWRREVAPKIQEGLARMQASIQRMRNEARQKGVGVSLVETGRLDDVVVNLDEKELAEEAEELETTLGTLDGLLSLKNAVTTINV